MDSFRAYSNKEEVGLWGEFSNLLPEEFYIIDKYIGTTGVLLEAGTGCGRIGSRILEKNPELDIVAFDFIEAMIECAKNKNKNKIDFRVADATDLSQFETEFYDYAVYLQQVLSLISADKVTQTLDESYRILKKDGIILFSFMFYDGRKINPILNITTNIMRFLRGEEWQSQLLPWMRYGGRINKSMFFKDQPVAYWFKIPEIQRLLKKSNFQILETKTVAEILDEKSKPCGAAVFIVCKK